jgi:ribosome-binding factor A
MAKYRRGRINDEMQRVLSEVLRTVKDPRVSDAFISVTACEVTGDLKYARVYYSAMQGDPKEVAKGLKSSAGYIRGQVARIMNLRQTPEFTFVVDDSIKYGAHISDVLSKITFADETEESISESETDKDEADA